MGIEPDDTVSPGVLRKMVYAGANASSFQQAERDLLEEAELRISAQRIARATQRIGQERIEQRRAATAHWRKLPLPELHRSRHEHVPQIACVQIDGGRIQIRERGSAKAEASADADPKKGFWREAKVACLLRMHAEEHATDPCPELPEAFANVARMAKLSREIKGFSVPSAEDDATCPREEEQQQRAGRPVVLVRNVAAQHAPMEQFAEHVAAAAWESGFALARRKAFVADGQESNWSAWRQCFSHYTPVLDFVHAACYVFQAAAAGRPLDDVPMIYRRYAQAVWSGRVEEVIAELEVRQQQLGTPTEQDAATHPRVVVAESLRYLRNQASRMRYDEYRRLGLPITTAYIESTIKQVHRRVKGTEKFWSETGAQALLQLRADYLSDRRPLDDFWQSRAATLSGQRSYR